MTIQYAQTNINTTKETVIFAGGPITIGSSVGSLNCLRRSAGQGGAYQINLPNSGEAIGQAIDISIEGTAGALNGDIILAPPAGNLIENQANLALVYIADLEGYRIRAVRGLFGTTAWRVIAQYP